VATGRFREDLYYLLTAHPIGIPALRERREDLPYLVRSIVSEFAEKSGLASTPIVSREAMATLVEYDWRGNFSELRNVLERSLIMSKGMRVEPEHIVFDTDHRSPSAEMVSERPTDATADQRVEPGDDPGKAIIAKLLKAREGKPVRNPSKADLEVLYDECVRNRNWPNAKIGRELGVHPTTVLGWFERAGLLPPKPKAGLTDEGPSS
jgi:DNA-binding NtrC family response regulator